MKYVGTELDVFATATRWKYYVRDMLRPHISGRILEVGAGIGSFTEILSQLKHARWLCLEPDPDLARQFAQRQEVKGIPPDVELVTGTERDLPPDQVFDTILYLDVLEHILDDRAEISRAAERLAPAGRLIILCPAFQTLFSNFDAAIGHFRRYTITSLEQLRADKLSTVAAFYLDAPGAVLSLANRILLKSSQPTLRQVAIWDKIFVPIARVLDMAVAHRVGRSVVLIWRKSQIVSAR